MSSPQRFPLLDNLLANPYVMAIVKVSLVLYAASAAPRLPIQAREYLNNTYVKMGFIFLMVYLAQMDFQLALIVAIAYVASINMLSGRSALESYANFVKSKGESQQKLIEPKLNVYPGCMNLKMSDLLKAFQDDEVVLQQSIRHVYHELLKSDKSDGEAQRLLKFARMSGVPHNVEMTDENAPLIATMLMYYGFQFSDDCKPPQ